MRAPLPAPPPWRHLLHGAARHLPPRLQHARPARAPAPPAAHRSRLRQRGARSSDRRTSAARVGRLLDRPDAGLWQQRGDPPPRAGGAGAGARLRRQARPRCEPRPRRPVPAAGPAREEGGGGVEAAAARGGGAGAARGAQRARRPSPPPPRTSLPPSLPPEPCLDCSLGRSLSRSLDLSDLSAGARRLEPRLRRPRPDEAARGTGPRPASRAVPIRRVGSPAGLWLWGRTSAAARAEDRVGPTLSLRKGGGWARCLSTPLSDLRRLVLVWPDAGLRPGREGAPARAGWPGAARASSPSRL